MNGGLKTDHLRKSQKSVDWQGVMGNAGTRIPEDPFTSAQRYSNKYCGAYCPGYLLSGSHPQTPGELATNVKVCYNCEGVMCNYSKNYVKIRHCGDYFVYYLTEYPETWELRYCTE